MSAHRQTFPLITGTAQPERPNITAKDSSETEEMARPRTTGEHAALDDDELRRLLMEQARAITAMAAAVPAKNGSKMPIMGTLAVVGIFGVGSLVTSVSVITRSNTELEHVKIQLQETTRRLDETTRELKREVDVNRRVEDERYRDLEIKLAAKKIITPGMTR